MKQDRGEKAGSQHRDHPPSQRARPHDDRQKNNAEQHRRGAERERDQLRAGVERVVRGLGVAFPAERSDHDHDRERHCDTQHSEQPEEQSDEAQRVTSSRPRHRLSTEDH